MAVTEADKQLPDEFQQLTPAQFHTFYKTFMGLRFPMEVSEVLDLRSVINHAVDEFTEPPLTPDYRQFRDSLERALDSFGIESPHHRERMLKTLTMMREFHVAHSLSSRNAEEQLRLATQDNHTAHRRAVRNGLIYISAMFVSFVGWYTLPEHTWMVQVLSLLCAVQAFRNFHALPHLEQRARELRQQLNDVLRQRVNALNWKSLIHKLALVLGIKKIEGVEVFRLMTDTQEIRNISGGGTVH